MVKIKHELDSVTNKRTVTATGDDDLVLAKVTGLVNLTTETEVTRELARLLGERLEQLHKLAAKTDASELPQCR